MSMVSPDSCISSAVAAVAYANFSARYKSRVANELSSVCYCITLRKLATLMTNPVEMQQKGVLLVIYLLALYENSRLWWLKLTGTQTLTSAIRDGSWVTHMEGAQSILAHRESINCKEGDKYLSVLCTHLIVYYLKESKTPPLHFDSWLQSIPFHSPHNKQLVFLMLRTAEASIMLKEESATDRLIIPKLLDSALSLDFQLEKWASDVPLEWSYMARHPISHHGHPKLARELLDLPYAPRYMLLHSGILAAADWNMYRATRIRLNLAILEFLYKVPSNDLESQNLKCHITDLLSTLTHEIAYAIPYSLSLPADGTSDSQSAEGIPGLEAYVQLWPVLTGYICSRHRLVEGSGCVQTADWFKAILCFMRDSVGLAKVHLLLEEAAPS
ncbi:unnamed protein product [Penicillium pancosmium]